MFEAQELMEQLTLEKNAEIALKLAEIENEKKQLHARRQLLNALLETFLNDKYVPFRYVEHTGTYIIRLVNKYTYLCFCLFVFPKGSATSHVLLRRTKRSAATRIW